MRRTLDEIALALGLLGGLVVVLGLLLTIVSYRHVSITNASCGGGSNGTFFLEIVPLWGVALFLVGALTLYVAVTATQDRRWAWLAAAALSVAAAILIAQSGGQVVAAVLGAVSNTCEGLADFVADFVAFAVVGLICAAYLITPRPVPPRRVM